MIDVGATLFPARVAPLTADARPSVMPALWMARGTIMIGWTSVLSGFGLFGWECLAWLRNDAWHQASLADLWGHVPLGGDRASAGWADVRGLHDLLFHVLHWFGRFPISLTLVAVGLAVAWTGNGAHDRAEQRLAQRARR